MNKDETESDESVRARRKHASVLPVGEGGLCAGKGGPGFFFSLQRGVGCSIYI